jgi:hypothetical protein
MAHTLILGITESGKTTLAMRLAQSYRRRRVPVLVLEPFRSSRWNATYITDNADDFLKIVFANRSCAVFVDEAGDMIGRYSDAMNKLATLSRHYGHNAHFICQRAMMISPTIRAQCSNLFLFKQSTKDAELLSRDFVAQFDTAKDLRKGEFLAKVGIDGKVFKGKVF